MQSLGLLSNLPLCINATLDNEKLKKARQQMHTITLKTGEEYGLLVPTTNCSISLIVRAADAHMSGYIGYMKRSSL